jgi:hypothetical protein
MPDLQTARLLFRKFTADDFHDLCAIRADPDVMNLEEQIARCLPK